MGRLFREAWAVVLATGRAGQDPSLLSAGLARALAVAAGTRVISVVTQAPGSETGRLPAGVIAQPADRGSAESLLLALQAVAAHDRDATLAVFPTDHFVRDEATLAEAMRDALELAKARSDMVYLLGMEPDHPRGGGSLIVPRHRGGSGASRVARFVAAPNLTEARAVHDEGGLWNTLMLAASLRALLGLYERHGNRAPSDLTRDVLAGQEDKLRVLPVAHCGWDETAPSSEAAPTLRQKRASSYGGSMRLDAAD
jgi:mannose-1-phosphate guanylyltransferase